MWRRATSANSAAVNMPNGATNSLLGRVHGAVAARSTYTPAVPAMTRTLVAIPAAIAVAACRIAGMPDHDDVTHTGARRAWYTKSLANWPTTPSTSRDAETGVGEGAERSLERDRERVLALEHARLLGVEDPRDGDVVVRMGGHHGEPTVRRPRRRNCTGRRGTCGRTVGRGTFPA